MEMTQLVKCQPCKPADLHSDPSTHVKHQTWQHTSVTLVLKEYIQMDPLAFGQATIVSQWGSVRDRVEDPRKADEARCLPPVCPGFLFKTLNLTDWLYRVKRNTERPLCSKDPEEREEEKRIRRGRGDLRGVSIRSLSKRKAWPQLCVRMAS